MAAIKESDRIPRKLLLNRDLSRYPFGERVEDSPLDPMQATLERYEIRRTRRVAPFVLLLFATMGFLLIAPTRSDATCGDYLSDHMSPRSGHTDVIDRGDPVDPSWPLNPPGSIPCQGPLCKQGQSAPPLSIPIIAYELQDRWLWSAVDLFQVQSEVSFMAHSHQHVDLLTTTYRLDRPPRSVSRGN
jgi:hypothetical protein